MSWTIFDKFVFKLIKVTKMPTTIVTIYVSLWNETNGKKMKNINKIQSII